MDTGLAVGVTHTYTLKDLCRLRLNAAELDRCDANRVIDLGISRQRRRRRRGCRAGQHTRARAVPAAATDRVTCQELKVKPIPVVVSFPQQRRPRYNTLIQRERVLTTVRQQRHDNTSDRSMNFGCFNVRSLNNKLDDVIEVSRVHGIDVLFLVETWHDHDAVCIRRLRADGFTVVDVPRPRTATDTMLTNHGGVAAVAFTGARVEPVNVGATPVTFEFVCVRVSSGAVSYVVCAIYRPGSQAVSATFFSELGDVLDRLATFVEPLFIVGDLNVHLERSDDASAVQLIDLLASYGLSCRVTAPTHDLGGLLDIVASRDDLPNPSVDVIDVGLTDPRFCDLSDHRLLRWAVPMSRPPPVYTSTVVRPWRQLDGDAFRESLQSSLLCQPESWKNYDVDGLARLYDTEIGTVLDRLIPQRTVTCRRRPSDPWFDQECRNAKRRVRRLERESRRVSKIAAAAPTPANTAKAATAAAAWNIERRVYRDLLRQKREGFWQAKVESERSSPHRLWKSIDSLMGRGRVPLSTAIDAHDLHRYFDDKIAGVRESTADAPPPCYTPAPPDCNFSVFRTLRVDEVIAVIRKLPNKQCNTDPIPTSLLKDNVDLLAPFLTELFNRSLSSGVFPTQFKAAFITPLLKKPDLDPSDGKSYRPISNLTVLSKTLERLVAQQLIDYVSERKLLPELQSAYRANHSTETAVLRVLSDILGALDRGDLAALTLLDLSAAFDTVDHTTLIRRLEISYGIGGTVLGWFSTYLDQRLQFVRCRSSSSTPSTSLCGVPQGSVLGPILFLLYTADLIRLIEDSGLHPHLYADDTQIYGFCSPRDTTALVDRMTSCISDVCVWMKSNRLQLNASKTEFIWCASCRQQHQIPTTPLVLDNNTIKPVSCVRDLGIYIDSDMSMKTHVSKTVSCCFNSLRQIRSIRRSVSRPVLLSLVTSLVLTRLDYGSATLAGVSGRLLDRLQSVLNAAARLVCDSRKYDHISPLLRDLHWLRVPDRIKFRLAVLVFRCRSNTAPAYLSRDLHWAADSDARRRLRSSSSNKLVVPRTRLKTVGDRAFGTAAARIWNDLPPTITNASSISAFKKHLKFFLFN